MVGLNENISKMLVEDEESDLLLIGLKNTEEDPIIVKRSGPGQQALVNILLSRPEKMGWTIATTGETTTIIIPSNAAWRVRTDRLTGKVFLQQSETAVSKNQLDSDSRDSSQENAEKLAELFQQWNWEEVDDSEALDDEFLKTLDDDRASFRKLFPPELKGISW